MRLFDLCIQFQAFMLPWVFHFAVDSSADVYHIESMMMSVVAAFFVQIISCGLNMFSRKREYKSGRRYYEVCVLLLIMSSYVLTRFYEVPLKSAMFFYACLAFTRWYFSITVSEMVNNDGK